jgi:predicted nucleic acid-binding Zn ribbon protein
MFKKSNEQNLGDVIKAVLKDLKLEEKLYQVRVHAAWEKAMGKNIARYTEGLSLKNQVLFVSLKSSTLREELSMARTKILVMINQELEGYTIKEIVFK